ncbi:Hypothetical protein R9X50_00287000 [Acrodontium crateriforme]|uniref:Uncharacterized protein n=1 Tax=Acrodontium crateriforme TaxID=150365 RepID=A0AAQ3M7X4_9PEZI|nr:Hypothetical protein R9X50_00287000 [Acrodontium crateriforme]
MRQTEIMDRASASGQARDMRHVNSLGKPTLSGLEDRETEAPIFDRRRISKSSIASCSSSSFRGAPLKHRTLDIEREFSEFLRNGDLVDWNTWDLAEPSNFIVHSPWTCNGSDTCENHVRTRSLPQEQFPDREEIQSTAVKRLVQIRNHLVCATATESPTETSLCPNTAETLDRQEESLKEMLKSFDCSCIECHHMLALHNAGMLEAEKCIHDGCNQIMDDPEDWLHHIMSRHHVSGKQNALTAISPAWSDYDSSTTHYFGEHW